MSQIGYMFLALGVGAWQGAIFHLMTHAFFKALLFLSSGAVILAVHHELDIFKMGGLRKKIPLVFWCYIIGGGALAAIVSDNLSRIKAKIKKPIQQNTWGQLKQWM